MKFGALNKTANVEIIVNIVNMIRHKRSTTIAANFQSFVISLVSSSFRSCSRWIVFGYIPGKSDDIDIWSDPVVMRDVDDDNANIVRKQTEKTLKFILGK